MAISLRALKARQIASAQPIQWRTVPCRQPSLWQRHSRWLRVNFRWPARVVIVVGEIALAYMIFVFGFALGIALRYLIVSS